MRKLVRLARIGSIGAVLALAAVAVPQEDPDLGMPDVSVPPDLILQLGTTYRYELEENAHIVVHDLTTGSRKKTTDTRAKLTSEAEFEVTESGPEGVTLRFVLKRITGTVTRIEGKTKVDSEEPGEMDGLVTVAGLESFVKLSPRGEILEVSGALMELIPEERRKIGTYAKHGVHSIVARFIQPLPAEPVAAEGKWTGTRMIASVYPPEGAWSIGEFEETYFVKSIDGGLASIVVSASGSEESPRKRHKKKDWGEETDIGSAKERWQFSGTAEIDTGSGQTTLRSTRGECTTYSWMVVGGKPSRLTQRVHKYTGTLRLTETIKPGDAGPSDE